MTRDALLAVQKTLEDVDDIIYRDIRRRAAIGYTEEEQKLSETLDEARAQVIKMLEAQP